MKVYDCFTFFNEFELLELRLESLWDLVDYFVIVEANKTHANEPKPFNFFERQKEFKKYFKKIRYVMDDSEVPYSGVGDWSIENNQRNNIIQGLQDAEPDDLIFISDVDEIPNPQTIKILLESQHRRDLDVEVIQYFFPDEFDDKTLIPFRCMIRAIQLLNHCPVVCKQRFHCYYFDLASLDTAWEGTVIGKFKFMKSPQAFRNFRRLLPRIVEGGWHFSYMGGVEKVITKMYSTVENKELSVKDPRFLEKKFVEDLMASGTYCFDNKKFSRVDVNDIALPKLKNFLEKYPHFVTVGS